MRILVIDDSTPMRNFIRRVAKLSGASIDEVVEAKNGQDALERLQDEDFDVICTDINMAVMSGKEFIRRLMSWKEKRTIPVIVVSSEATPDRISELIREGAVGYVRKPFSPQTLGSELKRVLRLDACIDRWRHEIAQQESA